MVQRSVTVVKPLSARLRAARLAAGLKQVEVAAVLGVRQSAVSGWELRNPPSVQNVARLARLYNVSVDFLVQDLAGPPHTESAA